MKRLILLSLGFCATSLTAGESKVETFDVHTMQEEVAMYKSMQGSRQYKAEPKKNSCQRGGCKRPGTKETHRKGAAKKALEQ